MRRLLAAGALALALTSCSSPEPALRDEPGGGAVTAPAPPPTEAPDPTRITIPKIEAESSLIPLGLTLDGELEVPDVDEPAQAGWYAGENKDEPGDEWDPGEPGPAVIAGHVDGLHPDGRKGKPGIFARLDELDPGDEVVVEQANGDRLTYRVTAVEQVPKAEFPWDRVMAENGRPTLQLITCGGAFDRATGHYLDNTIVWTELAS